MTGMHVFSSGIGRSARCRRQAIFWWVATLTISTSYRLCRAAGVGDEAGAADAVNCAGLVVLGSVAADPDGAEDLARTIADQDPARHRDDAASGVGAERLDEDWVARRAAGELPP